MVSELLPISTLSMLFSYTKAILRPTPEYMSLFYSHMSKPESTERLHTDAETNGFWNLLYFYFASPIEIIPNLYLGNIINSANYEQLEEYKIKTIFNVTAEHSCFFEDYFNYHRILIEDNKGAILDDTFYQAVDKLKEELDKGEPVLVHCHHGRSRSVSLILAYLLKYHPTTYHSFTEAYEMMKTKKNIININKDFAQQLKERFD